MGAPRRATSGGNGRHRAEVPLAAHPGPARRAAPLDPSLGEEVEARLPAIVGGLSVALAQTFRIMTPG